MTHAGKPAGLVPGGFRACSARNATVATVCFRRGRRGSQADDPIANGGESVLVFPVVARLVFIVVWVVVGLGPLGNELQGAVPGVTGEASQLALQAIAIRVGVIGPLGRQIGVMVCGGERIELIDVVFRPGEEGRRAPGDET